ncbi:MAG TPA: YigZ family protein, partial [Bacteroidota bacterium]|nr:YigZ family protein [Bacteroidota bacterium]
GAIEGAALSDLLVVVTRYFGGTKLGVGGLGRAYRDAAAGALARGTRAVNVLCTVIDVATAHDSVGPVMKAATLAGGKILSSRYDADVQLAIEIRRSRVEGLRAMLLEAARGNVRISVR